ncbi:hypothetical protein M2150_001095 [Lachnospiraceae bacterium PM6-15]|uniref:hypothetical protein n=1 Tax=Ohessyouella blattaphilus TaxID=2949333 RepID=UPI003E238039
MVKTILKNKKTKYVIAALLIVALVGVGITVAYLISRAESVTNTFEVSEVTTYITEEEPKIDDSITKEPKIKSEAGSEPALVRARVTVPNGDFAKYAGIVYNKSWKLNEEDGYYYYQGILEPGETTLPIFNTIDIDEKNAGEKDHYTAEFIEFVNAGGLDVAIYHESVQAYAVLGNDGNRTYAYDKDGKYLEEEAKSIWKHYDNETGK